MADTPQNILFGKFETIECLKKEESGSVWLARHIHLDQPVILKILLVTTLADPAGAERFKREARLLARLSHPNIIRVLDFSVDADCFYISFEYFPSTSLRQRLREKALALADQCAILRQVAAALAAAHAQQIIHRDVKPENILIDERGRVKLADFGLAFLQESAAVTRKSAIVGTPGYMSPEQIRGEPLTPASDLFSLGIIAHELFFGRHPYVDSDVGRTLNNILAGEEVVLPEEPGLPEALRQLTAGLLRKERQQRIGTAQGVIDRIEESFPACSPDKELEPLHIRPCDPAPQAGAASMRRERRKRLAWGALLTLAMTAAVLLLKNPLPSERQYKPPAAADTDSSAMVDLQQRAEAVRASGEKNFPAGSNEAGAKPKPAPAGAVQDRVSLPAENTAVMTESAGTGAMPGKLYITCKPWAEVFIDSVRVDATPLQDTLRLFPGMHELVLSHPDYPPYRQILRMQSRQTLQVAVDLDTLFGFVELHIYPWAEVSLDGFARGQTPFARPLAVEAGSHRLKLHHPQYGEVEDFIKVVKSETTRFTMNLGQLAGKRP
jgi:serine/threonine-protein kinase